MDLDSLWGQVKPHIAKAKQRKDTPAHTRAEPSTLFTNPANWRPTHGVALIHADSETLLGNFTEYVHKTVPNCRKLIHDGANLPISAVEYVKGSWWLGEKRTVVPPMNRFERRPYILHLDLLNACSPCVEVVVCLDYGAVARVELLDDTHFTENAQEGLLFLPAGTDVLPVMTLECKVQMRRDLSL